MDSDFERDSESDKAGGDEFEKEKQIADLQVQCFREMTKKKELEDFNSHLQRQHATSMVDFQIESSRSEVMAKMNQVLLETIQVQRAILGKVWSLGLEKIPKYTILQNNLELQEDARILQNVRDEYDNLRKHFDSLDIVKDIKEARRLNVEVDKSLRDSIEKYEIEKRHKLAILEMRNAKLITTITNLTIGRHKSECLEKEIKALDEQLANETMAKKRKYELYKKLEEEVAQLEEEIAKDEREKELDNYLKPLDVFRTPSVSMIRRRTLYSFNPGFFPLISDIQSSEFRPEIINRKFTAPHDETIVYDNQINSKEYNSFVEPNDEFKFLPENIAPKKNDNKNKIVILEDILIRGSEPTKESASHIKEQNKLIQQNYDERFKSHFKNLEELNEEMSTMCVQSNQTPLKLKSEYNFGRDFNLFLKNKYNKIEIPEIVLELKQEQKMLPTKSENKNKSILKFEKRETELKKNAMKPMIQLKPTKEKSFTTGDYKQRLQSFFENRKTTSLAEAKKDQLTRNVDRKSSTNKKTVQFGVSKESNDSPIKPQTIFVERSSNIKDLNIPNSTTEKLLPLPALPETDRKYNDDPSVSDNTHIPETDRKQRKRKTHTPLNGFDLDLDDSLKEREVSVGDKSKKVNKNQLKLDDKSEDFFNKFYDATDSDNLGTEKDFNNSSEDINNFCMPWVSASEESPNADKEDNDKSSSFQLNFF